MHLETYDINPSFGHKILETRQPFIWIGNMHLETCQLFIWTCKMHLETCQPFIWTSKMHLETYDINPSFGHVKCI